MGGSGTRELVWSHSGRGLRGTARVGVLSLQGEAGGASCFSSLAALTTPGSQHTVMDISKCFCGQMNLENAMLRCSWDFFMDCRFHHVCNVAICAVNPELCSLAQRASVTHLTTNLLLLLSFLLLSLFGQY